MSLGEGYVPSQDPSVVSKVQCLVYEGGVCRSTMVLGHKDTTKIQVRTCHYVIMYKLENPLLKKQNNMVGVCCSFLLFQIGKDVEHQGILEIFSTKISSPLVIHNGEDYLIKGSEQTMENSCRFLFFRQVKVLNIKEFSRFF